MGKIGGLLLIAWFCAPVFAQYKRTGALVSGFSSCSEMRSDSFETCHGFTLSTGPGAVLSEAISAGLKGVRTEVVKYDYSRASSEFEGGADAITAVRARSEFDSMVSIDNHLIQMPDGSWRMNVEAAVMDTRFGQALTTASRSFPLELSSECKSKMDAWASSAQGSARLNPPGCVGYAIGAQREQIKAIGEHLDKRLNEHDSRSKSEAESGTLKCDRGGKKFHLRWMASGGSPLELDQMGGMDSEGTRMISYQPIFKKMPDGKCNLILRSDRRSPKEDRGQYAAVVDPKNPGKVQFRGRGQFDCAPGGPQMENLFKRCENTKRGAAEPGSLDDREAMGRVRDGVR